jgi:OmpA-OmpF porin, OOP family
MLRMSFDFGTDGLDEASKRILDRVVVTMNANRNWRLAIEGHTDAQGTPDYNQTLSERRAQAVKNYLEAAGIPSQRLSTAGFGASRALGPNNARGNALNRRVELYRH